MLALLLAASLPLQSVTSAVADLLGPQHAHRATPSVAGDSDPMAGWRDFRRAHYDHPSTASADDEATAHALAHATGERHHHDLFDTTVENVEPGGDNDGTSAGASASAVFVFILAGGTVPLEARGAAVASAWRSRPNDRFRSAETRRLERPPQRLG
jgi:hypothetical protein